MTVHQARPDETSAPPAASLSDSLSVAAQAALDRAVRHLLDRQEGEGYWRGLLETNVTMDAEDLMMRQFLGVRTHEQTVASARWIRSRQRPDGSWATFFGGPPDVSTTAEAYIALRLAGDDPDAPHMASAREVVLSRGGLGRTRVFTRIWLALFGQWSWNDLPALPPEIVLLPSWFPLNLHDFACWARQTIAPLTILATLRPRCDLGVDVSELRCQPELAHTPDGRAEKGYAEKGQAEKGQADSGTGGGRSSWDRFFHGLDRALHTYHRLGGRTRLRRTALERVTQWVVDRQEADGSWGGIQPPWVYSLMALHAVGYSLDHPVMAKGLQGWERFTVTTDGVDGPVRWIEACQSPVWDTALALVALGDAGLPAGHPSMRRAGEWLLGEEVTVRGDWKVRRPATPAGGWAFEFDNDLYPDLDDTAEVVLALRRTNLGAAVDGAVERTITWVWGMRSRNGAWAAFDADNTRELAYRLPFCDFGAVIDPPSADVTAHVVEMLAREGHAQRPEVASAVAWLRSEQEQDGSWFGRWGANQVYGTGAVVPALVAAGVPVSDPAIRRAVGWLRTRQNDDGGWGEDLRSYEDPAWAGRGESTPSQTAWALLALHAAGEVSQDAARRGVGWLVDHQREDGGWDEELFTGTGFPGAFYINYHLYRLVFPISALGRYLGRSS